MHEYLALLQDMNPPLDDQASVEGSLEALKSQLKQLEVSVIHWRAYRLSVGSQAKWPVRLGPCRQRL